MILVIDTSTMMGLCAIAEVKPDGTFNILYEQHVSAELSHSEKLFVGIKEALNSCSATFEDIKKVVYCSGPGSFTGLRISYSAVKGFFVAKGLEPFGVSTLKALVKSFEPKDDKLMCAIMPAGKNEFFAYGVVPEKCYTEDELLEHLLTLRGKNVTCVGQGALDIKEKLVECGANVPSKPEAHLVNARGMLCLLEEQRFDGINYLKSSYAEQRRKI